MKDFAVSTVVVLLIPIVLGSTCTNDYCKNGGTCSLYEGKANCSCPSNVTGDQCELDVDECQVLSDPCKNGATCTNFYGSYTCRCIYGWEGVDCAINSDDCKTTDSRPKCLNGGTCVDKVSQFECLCPAGRTGIICQFYDQCYHRNPCYGQAGCVPGPAGDAICQCPRGWTGGNCSIDIDECPSSAVESPCRQGGTCRNTPGSFVCDCPPGITGDRCEGQINECDSNPCKNKAACLNDLNRYHCLCLPGWTGVNCDLDINECDSNPCQNQGQCYNGRNFYNCTCWDGFTGVNCEININDCDPNPCQNGATCRDDIRNYTCLCQTGFTGNHCEVNVDDCSPMPCKNYGKCIDRINDYTCNCTPGYTGKNCDQDYDECSSNPCMFGGTCQDRVNGFECTCPSGTSGPTCEHNVNDCLGVTCKNGGTCIDQLGSYYCKCHPGFQGRFCDHNDDECAAVAVPCKNGGTCTDGVAQYHCKCPSGFTGPTCETKIDNCLENECQNGASCKSKNSGYVCICPPGYSGKLCSQDIDECVSRPCHNGNCIDGINSYICDCYYGFKGPHCEINIDDCLSRPCLHGSSCVDGINQFHCSCTPGFSGLRCEHHINECLSNPCLNGATCVDEIGSYSCYCKPGYTGRNCGSVIDWCKEYSCMNGGTCKQSLTHFNCTCTSGYTGVICDVRNITCAAARKTAPGGKVCKNGGTCRDAITQTCHCPPGFTGSYCEVNIDDCSNGPCKHGATCSDGVDNYSCSCMQGFTGDNCEVNIDECSLNPCKNGGSCIDLVNGFICSCPVGYVGNTCEQNPNDCFVNACYNGGVCMDGLRSFTCSCPAGYSGKRCQIDIDECASNPCNAYGVEQCYSVVNDYHCKCKLGFLGKHCEFDINECLSGPCQNGGTCQDEPGKHICFCQDGFSGQNCERVVSSCNDAPCLNGGTCSTASDGRYLCSCMPGVTGKHCEWNIDDCQSIPCQNGGKCTDGFSTYSCKCTTGFTGINCEQEVSKCQSSPCKHGGTCEDRAGHYRCECPAHFNGTNCEEIVQETCPRKDCAKAFDGAPCNERCNNHACDWDGTSCSLGIHPWSSCTAVTSTGKFCYEVFQDGTCDIECNTEECLFDGNDCSPPQGNCRMDKFCADNFENARCNLECNNKECLQDGLDCSLEPPELAENTLVLVLLVTTPTFRNGSRIFMRELSKILEIVAFIKRGEDGQQMIIPFDLPPGAPMPRSRRGLYVVASRALLFLQDEDLVMHHVVKRALARQGTEVHINLDKRGCITRECPNDAGYAARYLGALESSNKLDLPYPLYQVRVKADGTPTPSPTERPTFPPLWIAMLCVGIPMFIVGVLAGAKRVYAKLWLPEGFVRRPNQRQRSMRRNPEGQEVSMRSICKSSTDVHEEGACAEAETRRSDLTPPREAKRVKLDNDKPGLEDQRKWTRLHREVADVNIRTCTALALTPPQEGSSERGAAAIDVDARGPGGMTALHLAACRGNYVDGCSLDDDKDSDDSGGAMVSDLLSFGASYGSKTDYTDETALHLAARHSRADVAKRLLDAGADANARDRLKRTPLHLAIGADAQGVFQILLRNRATDLEARMDDGTTPLILAARHDLPDLVRHLIKAGAKVNNSDDQGKTALHWAASVNSLEVSQDLLRNGAKKDAQDEKGQTPLYLGCREGSIQTVRHLLVNFANRKLADNMDMTPEDIAKQRLHHDIEDLLRDWSLGCNSPKAVAPTSPPEAQKSPLTNMSSPPATSPPAVDMQHNGGPSVVAHFQAARPKTTVSRTQGTRATTPSNNNNNNQKRKRKKARPEDEGYAVMTTVTGLLPSNTHVTTTCASRPAFSPNCTNMTNGLSPLGSAGISPANSTTLSPLPLPTNLDTQPPSPMMFGEHPLEILSADDLAVLEDVQWENLDINDTGIDSGPFSPSDLARSLFPPTTSLGDVGGVDHIVPTTSDCMYVPSGPPIRRDPLDGQTLYSVRSTPDIPCAMEPTPRPIVINGRTSISAQKRCTTTPSQMASYQAITHSNMFRRELDMPGIGDFRMHENAQVCNQPIFTGSDRYPSPPSAHSYVNYDSSPQKVMVSFPTPSPDSPGQWSSASSSSSC